MSYLDIIASFELTPLKWLAIYTAIFILGMGKAGIKGFGVIIVVILAFVFGEKASTGILLPMLISADILAVIYYKRHVRWPIVFKLIPWMMIGVLVGVWVGNDISEFIFKKLMAVIIIVSVGIMLIFERRSKPIVPTNKVFGSSMGFLAGFTTMIGNLAGPIANIYFLAIRFPKNEFIGTAAWLFFIINVFKVPFHIYVWETIDYETFVLNTTLIPGVVAGFFTGVTIVKRITDSGYRKFILVVTILAGLVLLFRS
ncbi:sulfite exporter TauE/SafE family protein [Urechidicola sp. KH5]